MQKGLKQHHLLLWLSGWRKLDLLYDDRLAVTSYSTQTWKQKQSWSQHEGKVSQMSFYSFKMNNRMKITHWNEFKINHSSPENAVSKNSSDLRPKPCYRVSSLTSDPWLTFRCQMTRSVPGGQRGSSKDPAEMSALWGNNSATFHHFIIISLKLSSTGHTRHTRGRTGSQQPWKGRREEGGRGYGAGGAGALRGWAFKWFSF